MLKNKLPVKSDVQFLSKRKRAKAGYSVREPGVPAGSPGSKGPGCAAAAEKPGMVPGHALLTCLKVFGKLKLKS